MNKLILATIDPQHSRIVLESLPATIGTDESADIRLEDPWVSRFHCVLTEDGDKPRVVDLGTGSGTFVNGERVRAADLMLGDSLTVGRSTFVVYFEPSPKSLAVHYAWASDNPKLFSKQPAIAADGTLTFTPAKDAFGTAKITVQAKDNGGTTNGGRDTSNAVTFTITVAPVNDAPAFSKGKDITVRSDAGAQVIKGWATKISSGPTNEATQLVDFLLSTDHPERFKVQPTIAKDGTLSFTPSNGGIGAATVSVRLKDNGGTSNHGVSTSVVQTFRVTLTSASKTSTTDAKKTAAPKSSTSADDAGLMSALSDWDPYFARGLSAWKLSSAPGRDRAECIAEFAT
jgi:hypothetical protein